MRYMLFAIGIALIIGVAFFYFTISPKLGGKNNIEKLEVLKQSSGFKNGKFVNPIPTPMAAPKFSTLLKFFSKDEEQVPKKELKTKPFLKEEFDSVSQNGLSFSWFGHSSVLLKMDSTTLLIDPVFGKRASLFTFMGPKRFNYSNQYAVNQLPDIDIVLISHDHYDHLEYETILALKNKVKHFYVPLGVGAHLEKWGVKSEKITELDWWQKAVFLNKINLIFTPTRHFSGRGLLNRNETLWGSWSIMGKNHKVFFSGDSGYFDIFKEVGSKMGPFDLVFIENGQYNQDWASIHMMPEESALAAFELGAKAVVPIHWGKFSLSIHSWLDPIIRISKEAKKYKYKLLTPAPGRIMVYPWTETHAWWND